jgi:hypothetical protein
MTLDDIKALNDRLPSGWLPRVMDKMSAASMVLSAGQVSRVKNGLSQNDAVMAFILEVAAEEDARKEALARAMRGEAQIH